MRGSCPHGCNRREGDSMRVKNFTRWGGLALALMLLVMGGFVLAPSRALADVSVSSWDDLKGELPTESNADPVTISLSGDIVAPPDAEGFDIPFRDDVTINLNGHTINRSLDEPKAKGYVFSSIYSFDILAHILLVI